MKKMAAICISALVTVLCFAAGAYASENDFEFADGVITGYNGTETEVGIPREIDGQRVMEIADGALSDGGIMSLYLPDSITRIGEYALPEGIAMISYSGSRAELEKIDIGMQHESVYDSVSVDVGGWTKYSLCPLQVTIPEGLDYSDDGIEFGIKIMNMPAKAGGGCDPYDFIGFDGVKNRYPEGESCRLEISDSYRRLHFDDGETVKNISVVYYNTLNQFIFYAAEDDKCFGSGKIRLNSKLDAKVYPKTEIHGTITIPDLTADTSFRIMAIEGLKTEKKIMTCDFKMSYDGYVGHEKKSAEYSVIVKPNTEYTILLEFYDKEYQRMTERVTVGSEAETLDFTDIVRSPVIGGAIELPENAAKPLWTDGAERTVRGSVYLQSSLEPYPIIDEVPFTIGEGERSADFVLRKDLGGYAIAYYRLDYDYDGLCAGGHYYDDTKCVSAVSDAAALSGDREIVIKMLEADSGANVIDLRGTLSFNGDDAVTVFADTSRVPDTAVVIAAAYSEGRVIDCGFAAPVDGRAELKGEHIDCVKLFCFDDMDTMVPLCKPWVFWVEWPE